MQNLTITLRDLLPVFDKVQQKKDISLDRKTVFCKQKAKKKKKKEEERI